MLRRKAFSSIAGVLTSWDSIIMAQKVHSWLFIFYLYVRDDHKHQMFKNRDEVSYGHTKGCGTTGMRMHLFLTLSCEYHRLPTCSESHGRLQNLLTDRAPSLIPLPISAFCMTYVPLTPCKFTGRRKYGLIEWTYLSYDNFQIMRNH